MGIMADAQIQTTPDNVALPAKVREILASIPEVALRGQIDTTIRNCFATMAEIAEKFPQSQPAPFTYFQRAQLAGAAQNSDEVIRLMTAFVEKYPEDDKVFFAFDSIGQTETGRGNIGHTSPSPS